MTDDEKNCVLVALRRLAQLSESERFALVSGEPDESITTEGSEGKFITDTRYNYEDGSQKGMLTVSTYMSGDGRSREWQLRITRQWEGEA